MKPISQHMAELKPEDWRPGCDLDILAIAVDLHMWHTGASDTYLSIGNDTPALYLAIVKMRLANWTPSKYPFDDAVKALLEEVVKEAEGQGAWLYR